jgi:putative mRNA 3-end processing factor
MRGTEAEMNLSYQNANPHSGHESYYLKFEDAAGTSTNCVLVDSGENVDMRDDLEADEFLSSILLTHAHADHYRTIGRNLQDGAEILATPATASVMESVLSEASRHASTQDMEWEDIEDSVRSITDWHQVAPDVKARPVPAGHVPGACGFLIRFDDDRHILTTGDFTFDRAAGYPPFPEEDLMDMGIDVLFLNASTSETDGFTESIDSILEQAISGGQVLVAASGMTCVKYAYSLGHLLDRRDAGLTVSIVGQAAKMYEDLGYDVPGVAAYPVYEDTDEVFGEDICLSGPEEADEGSSGRLFGAIRDDPSATLVRVLGSHGRSTVSAGCTVIDFERVNHPTEEGVHDLVETLNPVQTVIQHGNTDRWEGDRFHFTMTWSDDSEDPRVLYSDGDWQPPVWLEDGTRERILENNRSRGEPDIYNVIAGDGVEEMLGADIPEIEPSEEPELTEEGVEIDDIPERSVEEDVSGMMEEAVEKKEDRTEGTEADDGEAPLPEIHETLKRIEKKIETETETHTAFVVDTAGGDLLLRVEDKRPGDIGLEHGDTVEVSVFEGDTKRS